MPRARQRGWTLIELMLGMTVGLFLAAVASTLMLGHWREHKHLLAETLLQQELRNAIALLRHEVHRSGADPTAHELVPERGHRRAIPPEPPRLQLLLDSDPIADDATGNGLSLAYARSEPGEPLRRIERGFRLHGTQLQYLLERSWQPWTDSHTVRLIRMELRLSHADGTLPGSCTCPRGACDPHLRSQVLHVLLVGQSRLDGRAVRSISSSIHVRNPRLDWPAEPC